MDINKLKGKISTEGNVAHFNTLNIDDIFRHSHILGMKSDVLLLFCDEFILQHFKDLTESYNASDDYLEKDLTGTLRLVIDFTFKRGNKTVFLIHKIDLEGGILIEGENELEDVSKCLLLLHNK